MRPPAAAVLDRLREPRLRARWPGRTGPEARFGVAGWIDEALNVAAVGEHEGAALAVEFRRVVAALPRRDVIGQPGDDIAVQVEEAHVERRAAKLEPAGMNERVSVDEIEEIGMQPGGQPRRVAVPVEDVESGRRVA